MAGSELHADDSSDNWYDGDGDCEMDPSDAKMELQMDEIKGVKKKKTCMQGLTRLLIV